MGLCSPDSLSVLCLCLDGRSNVTSCSGPVTMCLGSPPPPWCPATLQQNRIFVPQVSLCVHARMCAHTCVHAQGEYSAGGARGQFCVPFSRPLSVWLH